MTDFNTLIKLIDLELIKEANAKILELKNIVLEEKYNEESVIAKIKEVNIILRKLNNLPSGFFKDYRIEFRQWLSELEGKKKPFNDYMNDLKTIINTEITDDNIDEQNALLKEFNAKYNNKKVKVLLKESFEFDWKKVIFLQSKRFFIKFSWERKKIHFYTNFLFRFRFLLLKFLAVLFSFIITTFFAFILKFAFKQYSDFIISGIILIISFFTLDKWISKKSGKIFWRIVRHQTLILYVQLSNYTSQLALITNFMKSEIKLRKNKSQSK